MQEDSGKFSVINLLDVLLICCAVAWIFLPISFKAPQPIGRSNKTDDGTRLR